MEYSEFTKLASIEISSLYDKIEELLTDGDLDLLGGVLHVYTDQGDYVINQHSPTQQIWLSSPKSGAGYFNYHLQSKLWLDKNNVPLRKRLADDLAIHLAY